jgi:4-amino-4-deoxy-L-arabinose transferase-like glycosyltransferase
MLGPTVFRRLVVDFGPTALRDLSEPVLWLALFGAALWWWRGPLVMGGLLAFGLVPLLFVFAYTSESDVSRYYLAAYFALAALAAYGAQALAALPRAPRAAAVFAGAIVAIVALVGDFSQNAVYFAQPHEQGASVFIGRVRLLTPKNAIVVAPWLYATSLGYAAYVDRTFGNRIVVTADPDAYLAQYRGWLRTRPVVVVSDDDERFTGLHARVLDAGSPHLYALR